MVGGIIHAKKQYDIRNGMIMYTEHTYIYIYIYTHVHEFMTFYSLRPSSGPGRLSHLNYLKPMVNKGKHQVEAWEKALVTCGYTDHAKNL